MSAYKIFLDFETRSDVDLPTYGVYNYVNSQYFAGVCMAYAVEDTTTSEVVTGCVTPQNFARGLHTDDLKSPRHALLLSALTDKLVGDFCDIYAWNAAFDFVVFERVFPKVLNQSGSEHAVKHFFDVMAQAYAFNLSGSLHAVAEMLGYEGKEDEGKSSMFAFSKVDRSGNPVHTPETSPQLWDKLKTYAEYDVELLYTLHYALPQTPEIEWVVNEIINYRGLNIDVALVEYLVGVAEGMERDASYRISEVTNGVITAPTQVARIKKVLNEQGSDKLKSILGDDLSLSAANIESALEIINNETDLVQELINLRYVGSGAAQRKYKSLSNKAIKSDAGLTGSLKGSYVLYGAGQTLRFSSRGVQMHNMPNKTASDSDVLMYKKMANEKGLRQ